MPKLFEKTNEELDLLSDKATKYKNWSGPNKYLRFYFGILILN